MTHAFLETLNRLRAPVQSRMQQYLHGGSVAGISDARSTQVEAFHWDLVRNYPDRGGKYLRPALLLLTLEAMTGAYDSGVQTAAALEISQNWLLVHDDVEDQSLLRRGEDALQIMHGDAHAINAGDALHLLMWHMLRDNEPILGASKTLAVMDEFHRMLYRTCVGQTAELMWQKRLDFTEDDYFYIIDGKTGYYTIAGGMRLGAIIASTDPAQLDHAILPVINRFGVNLGRAFQIIDDVLDVASDGDGKQRGGDIAEGKITLLLAHLLAHASEADRDRIDAVMCLPREAIDQAMVDEVIGLMEAYGSIAYARQRAAELAGHARDIFGEMDFLVEDGPRAELAAMIDFITARGS
ncbi:MAG: polyprenyl synthetase family protein [Chloroflexi bacterium]|nr:polyprenyl synthetase family protein [Chloroflexota bacterium]